VSLQPNYFAKLKEESEITEIYARVFCGYMVQTKDAFYLEEVKLFGQDTIRFDVEGQANFEDVKFSKSSLRKQMSKFSIIVSICAKCEDD